MVFADLLVRYLQYRGYDVRHVMNITDLDDKTIQGSEAAGKPLAEFTREHIDAFRQDLTLLGVQPAAAYPRASEHIDDMIRLAEKLAQKGYAYEKLRSLYFDISRFADYGRLSGVDLNKIRIGATVDLDNYEKDNPRDFTLFKRSRLSELKRGIYTKTRWGNVRPSWHIQCAAMSMKYLGRRFDIHTSSRELVFPHHENEIAIAAALYGSPMANYWLHCETVLVDGKKAVSKRREMSLAQIREMGYSGREIRYWLITTHYRRPLIFSPDRLGAAAHSLKRLDSFVRNLQQYQGANAFPDLDQLIYDLKNGFTAAMDDDLNISVAMAKVFSVVRRGNRLMTEDQIDAAGCARILETLQGLDAVLNFLCFDTPETRDGRIEELQRQRDDARRSRDWKTADRLREQLRALGIEVRDKKLG
jgi:cysteinyl-tRNA synthetase